MTRDNRIIVASLAVIMFVTAWVVIGNLVVLNRTRVEFMQSLTITPTPKITTSFDKTEKNNLAELIMKLQSPDFPSNGLIPSRHTCDGVNAIPQFEISDVPANTNSLTLIVHDPDAPSGDWTHWTIWNLPPNLATISAQTIPAAATQGKNDFGTYQYAGPCPPSGFHRYIFTLYALDTTLDLDRNTTRHQLLQAMDSHILSRTELMGTYTRSASIKPEKPETN